MKITVTQQEANALGTMMDIYLKSMGVNGLDFANTVRNSIKIEEIKVKDLESYDKKRMRKALINISDILIDWSITKKIED